MQETSSYTSVIFKAHETISLSEWAGSDLLQTKQKGVVTSIIGSHHTHIDLEENLPYHHRSHL